MPLSNTLTGIETALGLNFHCLICNNRETEGFFVQINTDSRELEITRKVGDEVAGPLLCGSCMEDSVAGIRDTFNKPLRDMPLMLHHENPFVREIVRSRLKNEY